MLNILLNRVKIHYSYIISGLKQPIIRILDILNAIAKYW